MSSASRAPRTVVGCGRVIGSVAPRALPSATQPWWTREAFRGQRGSRPDAARQPAGATARLVHESAWFKRARLHPASYRRRPTGRGTGEGADTSMTPARRRGVASAPCCAMSNGAFAGCPGAPSARESPARAPGTNAARAVVPSIRLTAGELLEQYRCLERIMSSIRCGNGPSVSRCCFSPSSRPQRNTEHVAGAAASCGGFRARLSQAVLLQRRRGCWFDPGPRGGSASRPSRSGPDPERRGAFWGCPTFWAPGASTGLVELIGLNVIYSRVRAGRAAALSLGSNS